MMNKIPKYREGLQYSEEVKNSVRYGYLYRKDAEKNLSVHACISDTPDFLLWLANAIIGGFAWDVLKSASKRLYRRLKKHGNNIDEKTMQVLNDEDQLYQFNIYIREFNERRMSVDEEQLQYIKEEVEADFVGSKLARIMSQERREATTQEIMEVYKDAQKHSDDMLENNGTQSWQRI